MALRPARRLSEEDRALWHAWAARTQVQPLKGRDPFPVPASPPLAPAAAPAPTLAPSAPARTRPAAPPELQIGHAPGGLDARRLRDLRRGKQRPERRLDLHGKRAQEAHHAVRAFLHSAFLDGLRCVEVVTGKGPAPEGGVLRRELPHWINAPDLRPLLLGAIHAPTANTGAVYLLLRRRK
jgi:DNA-nicking Smr family endonuclease